MSASELADTLEVTEDLPSSTGSGWSRASRPARSP
jgi:hypothetical protein